MKKFVIGDVHGGALALIQVLERSGFDYEKDLLITLGDIVDGWEDTYLCVEELLKIKNRIDIMGNHDQWFYEFITSGVHPDVWRQGGLATARSYAKATNLKLLERQTMSGYMLNFIPEDIPETHRQFFLKQNKYYKDEDNNLFIHGGFDKNTPLGEQLPIQFMWDRRLWNQALSAQSGKQPMKFIEDFNKIFIGHTTTGMWGKDTPMKADIVWNLDTGAGWEGKLTIMNVDTEEYWQSDTVKTLYPNEKGR